MKSNTVKLGILTIGIGLIVSTASFAQGKNRQERTPPSYSELIKEMDKNEDGKLSKDEVKGPLKDDFTKIDTDEDGFISKKEFENAPKPKSRGGDK